MARVKNNMIISGVSGSLGEDYYARLTRDGRTIISKKPNFSNRQFSEGQLGQQSRVKQAAAYAKVASKKNPIYAQKAKGTSKNAYNLAFADWFEPPVIYDIQWLSDCIRVLAGDNVLVTRVVVTILDQERKALEQGEATLMNSVWWEYVPVNKGIVRVEAWDLAGNVTRKEVEA